MIYLVLFIAVVALCCGCASLVIAINERKKRPSTIKETVVRIERAPVEHPFTYDAERTTYTLDGDLLVTGNVSALEKGGKV